MKIPGMPGIFFVVRPAWAHSNLQDLMRQVRHLSIREQTGKLHRVLRDHYAYYGIAGNFRALLQVHSA
jgi:RNA-directed DNA polymerase